MSKECHNSHAVRFSWGASTYDYICTSCGATDEVPGGWGSLALPCPKPKPPEIQPETPLQELLRVAEAYLAFRLSDLVERDLQAAIKRAKL